MEPIYLDCNATTPVAAEVLDAMLPWLGSRCGNPSSLHARGSEAADAVGAARRAVARLIGARSSREVVFTSGGTEGDVAALLSHARIARERRGARRVIGTTVEHPAVLAALDLLEREGFELALVGVDAQGRLDNERFIALLDEADCAAATAMWANNETGALFDVATLGAACRQRGVSFHVDAVQAAGKLSLRVGALPIDTLALSAHKLHGPKGVGALYIRRGCDFSPLLVGGGQEGRRRAGTENVPGIVGFGRAAELALNALASRDAVQRLRDRLEHGALEALKGVHVNAREAARVVNTTNLRFEGLSGEALVALLSELGVCASAGSACAAAEQGPSHVLLALGLTPAEASSCVRFSLSRATTAEQVELALARLIDAVLRLRSLAEGSPRPVSAG
jgi:cysteine desulfurase